jgi:hypothetical protein
MVDSVGGLWFHAFSCRGTVTLSIVEGKVHEHAGRGVEFQFSNPLLTGLRFAWENRWVLLLLGLLPLLLELIITEDQFKHALPDRVILFVHVPLLALARAWRLAVIAMYAIQLGQGRPQSLPTIGISALQNLPKILISFALLFVLTLLGILLAPLMCFVVFFIWAPFFCVGELFVPDPPPRDEDSDYGWDDDPAEPEQQRVFIGRGVLELGFGRSIGLASRNLAPTLQVAALFWFLSTAPEALVWLIMGPHVSLPGLMAQCVVSSVATVFALGTVSSVFLNLLGRDARLELGLPQEEEPAPAGFGPYRRPLRLDRMFLAMMMLVSIAAVSTWYQQQVAERQRAIPVGAAIETLGAVVEGDRIAVTLRLTDPTNELRWLDPNRFVLSVGGAADEREMRSGIGMELIRGLGGPSAESQPGEKLPAKELAMLSRAYPFNTEGQPIENSNFTPYDKPLKLVLYFNIPDIDLAAKKIVGDTSAQPAEAGSLEKPASDASSAKPTLPASYPAEFYLYYSTYEGLGKPLFSGSLNLQAQ